MKFTLATLLVILALASVCYSKNIRGCKSVTKCTDPFRLKEMCMPVVSPVCGYRPDLVCVTTPCKYITYTNSCEACRDPDVISYTDGPCRKIKK